MDRCGRMEGLVEVSSSDDGDEVVVRVAGKKRSQELEIDGYFGEPELVGIHGNLSEQDHGEDDDVIVIDKPLCNFKRRRIRKKTEKQDEDDDCLILESAPPESVKSEFVESDVEELLVTGEVGPVACRDFPHSRHLCARFPFKTTAHLDHCSQCHCYVCETLAPCVSWTIHCHASDKEGSWKELRKSKSAPPGFSEAHLNTLSPVSVAVPRNHVLPVRSPPIPCPRNSTRPTLLRHPSPRMADYALGNVRRFPTSPTTTTPGVSSSQSGSPTAPIRFEPPSPRVRLPNVRPSHRAGPTTIYRPNPQPDTPRSFSPATVPSIPANVPMTNKVKLTSKKPRSSLQRHTKRRVHGGPPQGHPPHSNGQQVQVPGGLPPTNGQEALQGLPSPNGQGDSPQVQAQVQGLRSSNGQGCVIMGQQVQVRVQGLPGGPLPEQHVQVPASTLNGQQAQVPLQASEPRNQVPVQVLPHSNGRHVQCRAHANGQHVARRGSLPPPNEQVRASLPNGQVTASLPPGQQAIPPSVPVPQGLSPPPEFPVQAPTIGNSSGLQAFLEINQL